MNNNITIDLAESKLKEKKQPFFSIIILAFNQPEEIQRAINSVINQTFDDFEIIVVDDGSTDKTLDILDNFSKIYSNVKVIFNKINKSRYVSRKEGVLKAKGKWILFLDGDDYICPDLFEKLKTNIDSHSNYDALEFNYIEKPLNIVHEQISTEQDRFIDWFSKVKLEPTIWNKAYNSEMIKEAASCMNDEYINSYDDTCASIIISYWCRRVLQMDYVGVCYSNNQKGISTELKNFNKNKNSIDSAKNVFNELEYFFKVKNISDFFDLGFIKNKLSKHLLDNIEYNTIEKDIQKSFEYIFEELPFTKNIFNKRNTIFKKIKKILKKILKRR